MPSIAVIANPGSYSQARWTVWAAARAARRTPCGSTRLHSLDIARSVPAGFVAELRSKLRPGGVDRRFSLRSIGQRFCNNVADYNQSVFTRQFRRQDMQVVSACIGDLRVNGLYSLSFADTLRIGEEGLVFLEITRIINLASIGQRGQRHQAKIDPDFTGSAGPSFSNLYTEAEVPASARVLRKAAGFDSPAESTSVPKPIAASGVSYGVAGQSDGPGGRKRNPTKILLSTPMRTPPRGVSIHDISLADGLNGVAVQTKQLATSGRQFDKGKGAWPRPLVSSRRFLRRAAEVPDAIHRVGMDAEVPRARCVLDAVSVGENHEVRLCFNPEAVAVPVQGQVASSGLLDRGLRRRRMSGASRSKMRAYRLVGEQ
jgi:hypothetical protein